MVVTEKATIEEKQRQKQRQRQRQRLQKEDKIR